jgi:hypothetical protein
MQGDFSDNKTNAQLKKIGLEDFQIALIVGKVVIYL